MSLSGRVALVTGASQGIGKACVLKLAERGATVAVVARNEEKLKELVSHISGPGGKSAAFPMHVAATTSTNQNRETNHDHILHIRTHYRLNWITPSHTHNYVA